MIYIEADCEVTGEIDIIDLILYISVKLSDNFKPTVDVWIKIGNTA